MEGLYNVWYGGVLCGRAVYCAVGVYCVVGWFNVCQLGVLFVTAVYSMVGRCTVW